MASQAYIELLKDPRWQRKRLEIMQRDDFTCTACGDKESTLNVHHRSYHRGAKPWEYEADILTTLCESCHRDTSGLVAEISSQLGHLTPDRLFDILGYIVGMRARERHGDIGDWPLDQRFWTGIFDARLFKRSPIEEADETLTGNELVRLLKILDERNGT